MAREARAKQQDPNASGAVLQRLRVKIVVGQVTEERQDMTEHMK